MNLKQFNNFNDTMVARINASLVGNYTVHYITEAGAIRSTSVDADGPHQAKQTVFMTITDCAKTLKAEKN